MVIHLRPTVPADVLADFGASLCQHATDTDVLAAIFGIPR